MPLHADPRRQRLVGLLLLGIAAVLLFTSATWFASERAVVGVAQLAVAALGSGLGFLLLRRSQRP